MKTLRNSILIGLTVLGMGSATLTAYAAPAPGEHGAMMEGRHAKMAERMAEHMTKLHDKLKLTAAQEPAWATFSKAVTPPAMTPGDRAERDAMAKLPAPERAEKMLAKMKEHVARMESHLGALKTFYAVLTPEQKKVFDENAMRAMHGGRGGRGGHPMHQM
jgi:periplasmic protein CpxP/Spy